MSPYSFAASANCFLYEGAEPVFADVDPRTYNLDPDAVAAAITPRTKAVVAVDIFGYPGELDPLRALCEEHGLALVQDACEALGAEYRGRASAPRPVRGLRLLPEQADHDGRGRHGDDALRGRMAPAPLAPEPGAGHAGRWLDHARLGFNYRLDDIRAVIGVAQVEKLDTILELRAAAAARYADLLDGLDGLTVPLARRRRPRPLLVRLRDRARRGDRPRAGDRLARVRRRAKRALPAGDPPAAELRELYGFAEGLCPVAESLARRTLAIPFHTGIAAGRPGAGRGGPRTGARRSTVRTGRPGLGEALVAWLVVGLEAAATLVTYSRLQPELLYNVDDGGDLVSGLGRTLVLLNYPIALAAVALAVVAGRAEAARLGRDRPAAPSPPSRASSTRTTWTRAGSTRSLRSGSGSRSR